MELKDFLKIEKVRCVKGYDDCLEIGKEYNVIDIGVEIKVKDDRGELLYWESDYFEPVIDELSKSAENPLQDMKLTPEFETEASEPRFKVGDKVYCAGFGVLFKVLKVENTNSVLLEHGAFEGGMYADAKHVCHATPENHEMLCKLYPHIKFEAPPKPLTGSDLCFEKLRNGKKLVMCAVSDLSDEKAIKRLQDGDNCIRIIKDCDPAPYHFIDVHGIRHGFAVPLNDETGEPLTESVLDE